ncbi:MAG: FKBP-type peptidyl-prolyl cis-trans isomerase [Flavobacteriales bacterium]|nr:FKBP-type peptidyl-prolyl cis-trans isomerase [Flavobacteriales bacterium]
MSTKVELKSDVDTVSYGIGMNMVENIKRDFPECNFDAFIEGIKAAASDTNKLLKPEETQAIIQAYFQKKQEEARVEEMKNAEKIKTDGIKFLEENKKKPGVVTTASGLQYIVLKEGTGKQPTATSSVTVHYHGLTPEGVVFDSSVERGQPATFGLNQVIKGWTEGVQLMKEGAKYKFFIPQELAYGANPRPGGPIKPYMPLVFEVELISVNN